MPCKVNFESPEIQRKFQEESRKFGARTALETMLGTAENIMYENVEKQRRVDSIFMSLASGLMNITDSKGTSKLSKVLGFLLPQSTPMESLKAASHKEVEGELRRIKRLLTKDLEESAEVYNKDLDPVAANRAAAIHTTLVRFQELSEAAVKRLYDIRKNVAEREEDADMLNEIEEYEDSGKDRQYGQDAIESNPNDRMALEVQAFIATLPDYYFNKEGKLSIRKDDIGLDKLGNKDDFKAYYRQLFADVPSYNAMIKVLKDTSSSHPFSAGMYMWLKKRDVENSNNITILGKSYAGFKAALFSTYRTTDKKGLISTSRRPGTKTNATIYNADVSANQVRNVKATWKMQYDEVFKLPVEAKAALLAEMKKKYPILNKAYKGETLKNPEIDRLFKENPAAAIKLYSEMMSDIGIKISPSVIAAYREKALEAGKWKAIRSNRDLAKLQKTDPDAVSESPNVYVNASPYFFTTENSLVGFVLSTLNENPNNASPLELGSSNIDMLARAEAGTGNKNLMASGYIGANGEYRYPINFPNTLDDLHADLVDTTSERFESYVADEVYGLNSIIQLYANPNSSGAVPTIEYVENFNNMVTDKSVPYRSMHTTEAFATEINLFKDLDAKGNSKTSNGKKSGSRKAQKFILATPGDRKNVDVITIPRSDVHTVAKARYASMIRTSVDSEIARINAVRRFAKTPGTKNKIAGYETGAMSGASFVKWTYFESIPGFLEENAEGEMERTVNDAGLEAMISDMIDGIVAVELQKLKDTGLVSKIRENSVQFSAELTSLLGTDTMNISDLREFFATKMVVVNDTTDIFLGDIALFGNKRTSRFDEANKRSATVNTPGQKQHVGPDGASETYESLIYKDVKGRSEYAEAYNELTGTAAWNAEIDATDGAAFITLERYAEILGSMGFANVDIAHTINELSKENPDFATIISPLQPYKGFSISHRYNEARGRIISMEYKYAIVPIIPTAIKGNRAMEQILADMTKTGAQEAVFLSSVKFGAYNINEIGDTDLQTVTNNNNDWRLPQIVPYKAKEMERLCAQARVMAVGDLTPDMLFGSEKINSKELHNRYQDALTAKLELQRQDEIAGILTKEGLDVDLIASMTAEHLGKTADHSGVDVIQKMLEDYESHKDSMPLYLREVYTTVEKAMASKFKNITTLKLPGFVGVQTSAIGYNTFLKEDGSIKTSKKLRMAHMENGKVVPAEIRVSPHYFLAKTNSKHNEKVREYNKLKNEIDTLVTAETNTLQEVDLKVKNKALEELASEIDSAKELMRKLRAGENINLETLPKHLRDVVVYRVPTQGKNSMLPARIKSFLPASAGQTVILPAEITLQSGSDYDIDKVYLEFREVNMTSTTQYGSAFFGNESLTAMQQLNDTIVGTHFDVLTNPEVFKDVMTTNTIADITKHDAYLRENNPTFDQEAELTGNWGSWSVQEELRLKNQAASDGIGPVMIGAKGMQVIPYLGVQKGFVEEVVEPSIVTVPTVDKSMGSAALKETAVYSEVGVNTMSTNNKESVDGHFANPFTVSKRKGELNKPSMKQSAQAYKDWLLGYIEVPGAESQRTWILEQINSGKLDGAKLLYDISAKGNTSHAQALAEVVDEIRNAEDVVDPNALKKTSFTIPTESIVDHGDIDLIVDGIGKGQTMIASNTPHVYVKGRSYVVSTNKSGPQMVASCISCLNYGGKILLPSDQAKTLLSKEKSEEYDTLVEGIMQAGNIDLSFEVSGHYVRVSKTSSLTYEEKVGIKNATPEVVLGKIDANTNFDEFTINGVKGELLSSLDTNNEPKSKAFGSLGNIMLDRPELTKKYNLNEFTQSAVTYLVSEGVGLQYALMLINLPIVKKYTESIKAKSVVKSPFMAQQETLDDLKLEDIKEYEDLSLDMLVDSAKGDTSLDSKVIYAFRVFTKIGDDLYKFYRGTNTDTKGIKSSITENMAKVEILESIGGTISNEGNRSTNVFSVNPEMYRSHSFAKYEELLITYVEIMSGVALETTPLFKKAVADIEKLKGGKLDVKSRTFLTNDLYSYLLQTGQGSVLFNDINIKAQPGSSNGRSILSSADDAKRLSLFQGDNTLAKRTSNLISEEKKKQQKDSSYEINSFIKHLIPVENHEVKLPDGTKVVFDKVDFSNHAWNMLTKDEQLDLMDDYKKLLKNPLTVGLMVDLARANYLRSAHSFSKTSMLPAMHIAFSVDTIITGADVTIGRALQDQYSKMGNPQNFNLFEFKKAFIANRGTDIGLTRLSPGTDYARLQSLANKGLGLVLLESESGKVSAVNLYVSKDGILETKVLTELNAMSNEFKPYTGSDKFLKMLMPKTVKDLKDASVNSQDTSDC